MAPSYSGYAGADVAGGAELEYAGYGGTQPLVTGPPGPAGPPGATGPAGPGGAATALQITAATANGSFVTLPAGAAIIAMTLAEGAGHAVNVQLGTTSTGTQIMDAVALSAGQLLAVTPLSLNQVAFAASTAVYLGSTSWGGASVTMKVWYVS